MAAETERSAIEAAVERLRRVVGCLTPQPVRATRLGRFRCDVSFVPVGTPAAIRIHGGPARIGLDLKQGLEVRASAGGYRAQPVQYSYRLMEPEGREILAFHWHPDGLSPVKHPHLHLSSRIPALSHGAGASIALGEMHIPTGVVTFADVVRMLIEELGVEPRRADWQDVLTAGQAGDED